MKLNKTELDAVREIKCKTTSMAIQAKKTVYYVIQKQKAVHYVFNYPTYSSTNNQKLIILKNFTITHYYLLVHKNIQQ